jgi:EmrB/QacA subfamily drug resistance transporter
MTSARTHLPIEREHSASTVVAIGQDEVTGPANGTSISPTAGPTAASTAGPTAGPAGMSQRQFRMLLAGLIITLFLSALDNNIVGTAMPTIVGELGGFARYTWVTTAYVVTSTIATLILGKLSDLFGRRKVYLLTIVAFLVASALCGAAQNMNQLIAFRALQGIGGGGIWGLTFAIVGDIIPPRDRGRYFGLFTGVFALASVAGPLGGGLIVDNMSWRWIFYVNLPLGALSIAMVVATLKLKHVKRNVHLDIVGALLVAAAICALMIPLELGAESGWGSPKIVGSLVGAAVLAVLFVAWESKAPEPVLPLRLFRNRIVRVSLLLGLVLGSVMMTSGLFFALYFQNVQFLKPTAAGLRTLPIMFGMTISSTMTGRLITRTGRYKIFPMVGLPLAFTGLLISTTIDADTSGWLLALAMLLIGLGIGLTMPAVSISSQNSAEPRDLGIATSAGNFFRNLGAALGLALLGALFMTSTRSRLESLLPDGTAKGDVLSIIRKPDQVKALPPEIRAAVQDAISHGTSRVFMVACVISLVALGIAVLLGEEPLRSKSGMDMRAAQDKASPE